MVVRDDENRETAIMREVVVYTLLYATCLYKCVDTVQLYMR